MESFFGIMKSEMFYGQEIIYRTIEKLKGLTPIQYRNQSLLINV